MQADRSDEKGHGARTVVRWLMAAGYCFAGYKHLTAPAGFIAITPDWVPDPAMVVRLTGWCEVAGAIGLMVPSRLSRWARPTAGVGLALYALCVWPANINHAINNIAIGGVHLGWWYHGPRLLFQPVLIWAALWVGGVIRWPLRRRSVSPSA